MGMRAALVVVVLAWTAVARAELPPLPGPGPRAVSDDERTHRQRENVSCVGCHPQIGREWALSLHQHAWTDDVFQKAYSVEPVAFCRSCHAPESDPAVDPSARAQAIGVGCVTCHGAGGHVVGPRPAPATALHPVLADARLRTPAACASCHQFDFPLDAHQIVPEPMQDTVAEHAVSTAAATPCQGCHMPSVPNEDDPGRHKSHAFTVLADPARIKSAVKVSARRLDAGHAEISLVADRVGHAFPTGDMFRRVEVSVDSLDARGRVLQHDTAILARSFVDVTGIDNTLQRIWAEDTRVPAPGKGARVVVLRVAPSAVTTRYRVVYQRMSTPMAAAFGVSQILDQVEVAHGDLLPATVAVNHHQGERP